MTVAIAPPTLGNQAADWIEDVLGVQLDDEEVRFLQHAYEVRPDGARRWRRAFLSRLKGFGKTHFAAAVACLEFLGPSRCHGFDGDGEPVGVPATAPAVYFAATEESQAQLGYDDALALLRDGHASDEFDLDMGQTRTHLLGPGGGTLRYLSAGLPRISPHALRHGHGSALLEQGWALPAVSRRLGHRNTQVTAAVYAHELQSLERTARQQDELDQLYGGGQTELKAI